MQSETGHPSLIGAANTEILRAHAPLSAKRWATARDVEVSRWLIPAVERATVVWALTAAIRASSGTRMSSAWTGLRS